MLPITDDHTQSGLRAWCGRGLGEPRRRAVPGGTATTTRPRTSTPISRLDEGPSPEGRRLKQVSLRRVHQEVFPAASMKGRPRRDGDRHVPDASLTRVKASMKGRPRRDGDAPRSSSARPGSWCLDEGPSPEGRRPVQSRLPGECIDGASMKGRPRRDGDSCRGAPGADPAFASMKGRPRRDGDLPAGRSARTRQNASMKGRPRRDGDAEGLIGRVAGFDVPRWRAVPGGTATGHRFYPLWPAVFWARAKARAPYGDVSGD
jgi:hypothetical protein